MDKKLKHLEFIQAVINRMANTSFLLKGWSITVIAGLFALSQKEDAVAMLWLALILTAVFWFLDAYFLWQERLFRALYDNVRLQDEGAITFTMDPRPFRKSKHWYAAPLSITLLPFYGFVVIALVVFIIRFT